MTLSDALASLDTTRSDLIAILDGLSAEQRAFVPSPEAWSAEGVAEHLLLVEQRVFAAVEDDTDLGAPSPEAIEGVLGFMRSDEKAQTPPFLAPSGQPFATVRSALSGMSAHWHRITKEHEGDDRAVFRHPMAGPVSLLDTLRFVDAHAGHHRYQLARIAEAEGYPA